MLLVLIESHINDFIGFPFFVNKMIVSANLFNFEKKSILHFFD